jgi:hypothetical protein
VRENASVASASAWVDQSAAAASWRQDAAGHRFETWWVGADLRAYGFRDGAADECCIDGVCACARPSRVAEGSACAFALQMMMATAAPVRSGNVMRPPDISCCGEKISYHWRFIRKSRL